MGRKCFQGKVLVDGKPVSGADVEVEFYNDKKAIKAPADPFITQAVRTDDQGIFTYVMPWEGWWVLQLFPMLLKQ